MAEWFGYRLQANLKYKQVEYFLEFSLFQTHDAISLINLSNYQFLQLIHINVFLLKIYMWALMIYLALTCCLQVDARSLSRDFKTLQLRQQKSWIYLDRMQFAPGEAKFYFWTALQSQTIPAYGKYRLTLQIIPENLWEIELSQKCERPQQSADNSGQQRKGLRKQEIVVFLNPNNQLTGQASLTFAVETPTVYYIVLTDCDKSMVNEYFNKKSRFQIDVKMTNNNKNYGNDESIYNWLIPLIMVLCYGLVHIINKQNKSDESTDINWPAVLVRIIIWSHLIALSFFYCGHIIYVLTGSVYSFFGFIFLITSGFSEVMILILITFCAYGWMTTFQVEEKEEIYYSIASVFGFLYIVLSLLSKINDGDATKTHLYDSISSYIQILQRFIALVVFILGIALFYAKHRKNASLMDYMIKVLIFGIFCYVAMPGLILLAERSDKHRRWALVFVASELMKTLQMIILSYQVAHRGSIYSSLTMHDRSFMEHDNKYL